MATKDCRTERVYGDCHALVRELRPGCQQLSQNKKISGFHSSNSGRKRTTLENLLISDTITMVLEIHFERVLIRGYLQ